MTDDKQLLELAALACGIRGEYCAQTLNSSSFNYSKTYYGIMNPFNFSLWNPTEKTEQGMTQCFKMEEKLKLTITPDQNQWVISKGDLKLARHENRQMASVMAAAKLYELFGGKSEK